MQVSDSDFRLRSVVLHFQCLLGGLGHHFGSFGDPFWEPKSCILSGWGALGTQKKPVPKKRSKKAEKDHMHSLILESNLVPFFNVFWIVF